MALMDVTDPDGDPLGNDATLHFRRDVMAGLSARPKALPPKYFYDARGSELFEAICDLPEYYPTRTEMGILRTAAADVAARVGPDAAILEFGSGASAKVRLLLDTLTRPRAYVPVEISDAALAAAATALRADYPDLPVVPVHADYTRDFALPARITDQAGPILGFFPGSTIGNFEPALAEAFLAAARRRVGSGGCLLIGVDLVKGPEILVPAYDDAAGVTAAFNLNLLARINRELDGDFDLDQFGHLALFNATESRIEMHLESRVDQQVRVGDETFSFDAGETIHTENSYKFSRSGFAALAEAAGFAVEHVYTDANSHFAVILLRA